MLPDPKSGIPDPSRDMTEEEWDAAIRADYLVKTWFEGWGLVVVEKDEHDAEREAREKAEADLSAMVNQDVDALELAEARLSGLPEAFKKEFEGPLASRHGDRYRRVLRWLEEQAGKEKADGP